MTPSLARRLFAPLCIAALLALGAPAHADDPKPGTTDTTDKDGWEQVNTSMVQPGESFEAKNLVAAAYGFIWVMVCGFVYTVWRRTEAVESDLASLRNQIAARK